LLFLLPFGLFIYDFIRLGFGFFVVEISQISFKIIINIIYLYNGYEYVKIFGEI